MWVTAHITMLLLDFIFRVEMFEARYTVHSQSFAFCVLVALEIEQMTLGFCEFSKGQTENNI